jgi:PAS domain S-box-containing protein
MILDLWTDVKERAMAMPRSRIEHPRRAPERLAQSGPAPDLGTIIDSIPVLAWTAGPDGTADFFNSHWLIYTGLSREASVSLGWAQVLHPEDRDRVMEYWQGALSSAEPVELEVRLRRADGEYRWFLARANPLRDAAGRILKWYGTNTEINDRRRLEEALRESAETYRGFLDRVPAMIVITTAQGEVEFVNSPVLRFFDREEDDLRGWKQAEHVHPDDLPNVIASWSRAVAVGEACILEHRLRRHDGTYRWCQYRAVPQRDEQGLVIRWYCTITDLDDLKRQHTEIREMQARLSSATQTAAVSQLSAAIAQEINQRLAAVVMNTDACHRLLNLQPPNVERALNSLVHINRDATAAGDVVRRIRLLFQRAPLVKEPLDLNAVTAEVLQMHRGELNNSGVLSATQFDPGLPAVQGDRVQMQQVLSNLVRNAIEVMEESASANRRLLVRTKAEGNEAVVLVTDSGPCLDEPQLVLEPFYVTKRSGTGLGLAISRSIVEAHGGRLWVAAEPGSGTTFAFALVAQVGGQMT